MAKSDLQDQRDLIPRDGRSRESDHEEFTAALARALHRPALLPVPGFALKIALGGFSTEILGSKKVLPQALLDSGFTFDYPHITSALDELVQ